MVLEVAGAEAFVCQGTWPASAYLLSLALIGDR